MKKLQKRLKKKWPVICEENQGSVLPWRKIEERASRQGSNQLCQMLLLIKPNEAQELTIGFSDMGTVGSVALTGTDCVSCRSPG